MTIEERIERARKNVLAADAELSRATQELRDWRHGVPAREKLVAAMTQAQTDFVRAQRGLCALLNSLEK